MDLRIKLKQQWFTAIPLLILTLQHHAVFSQLNEEFNDGPRKDKAIRIAFYNVENLFDIMNDSLTHDGEFTPSGSKKWTQERFEDKLNKTAKTIIGIGGWEPPAIVGLCEIENQYVLEELLIKTPLNNFTYSFIHHESPDSRGIDVALLFRPDKFKIVYEEAIRVQLPEDGSRSTRDILYVKGIPLNNDTLHLFVNHWPSRYGGQLASEPKRMFVASLLRKKVDSLFNYVPNANIVITGDFNDHPDDKSISQNLNAKGDSLYLSSNDLYNLMYAKRHKEGTHKYQGHWGMLDQFIVSTALIKGSNKLKISDKGAVIFKGDWLLTDEVRFEGQTTFRTYQGPRYMGGFSDHLPIYLDLELKSP